MFGYACLEGTTEQSDGNRARSVQRDEANSMSLEDTKPLDNVHFQPNLFSPKNYSI